MKLELGLNKCSNADYHADTDYLSSSVLKKLLKDPSEYEREYILGIKPPKKQSNALDEGSLTHAVILEPELVAQDFNFYSGAIKKGAEYTAWLSTVDPNLPIISAPQKARVDGLVAAYRNHPIAPSLMENAEVEYTVCATIAGVKVKARSDITQLEKGIISDIKTTGYPGNHESFSQTVKDLDYGLSAALYTMVAEAHFGRPFDFYFIVLSKIEPYSCNVYKTSKETLEKGRRQVFEALELYKQCKASGVWASKQTTSQTSSEILEV